MCLIIYSPDAQNIPKKHMKRGLSANPHGWGFMFSRNGELVIRKGMSPKQFWAAWREENPSGPVVWHARIGTQGRMSEKNCHPFPIPNHDLAVAHNGVLNQHTIKNCVFNDTQLFVWDVLARLPEGFLDNAGIHSLIEHYLGTGKMTFMDSQGNVTILNDGYGDWVKDRWYSNRSYLPVPKVVFPKSKPPGRLLLDGLDWRVPALEDRIS